LHFKFFSLRAVYGTDDQKNALHGSDVFSAAEREIRFFFPDSKYHLFSRSQQKGPSKLEGPFCCLVSWSIAPELNREPTD